MKVLLLADISSAHTQKWALGLASAGIRVGIFSLNRSAQDWYSGIENISVLYQASEKLDGQSFFEKMNYLSMLRRVKNAIKEFGPGILHAHYASSYGMLGALSGFHPYIVSVWGADVYDFPKQSILHKKILVHNLKKADRILSTSEVMKDEIRKYTNKEILVTPFGVDPEIFHPGKAPSPFSKDDIIVGQVKSLEKKYGTSILVSAFAIAGKRRPELRLKLLLVGTGSLEEKLKEQVKEMGVEKDVVFTGRVPHGRVADYHRMLDIYVSVSLDESESFGVSAVEACACEKAVIVSRVGGLKEVIIENETGLMVEPGNAEQAAQAIIRFAVSEILRKEFGMRARRHVMTHYIWKDNLHKMVSIYREVLGAEVNPSK